NPAVRSSRSTPSRRAAPRRRELRREPGSIAPEPSLASAGSAFALLGLGLVQPGPGVDARRALRGAQRRKVQLQEREAVARRIEREVAGVTLRPAIPFERDLDDLLA